MVDGLIRQHRFVFNSAQSDIAAAFNEIIKSFRDGAKCPGARGLSEEVKTLLR